MTQYYHYGVQTSYTLQLLSFFLLLCSHYGTNVIKKLELYLVIVLVLHKIRFGHAEISLTKIDIPMLKTAVSTLRMW